MAVRDHHHFDLNKNDPGCKDLWIVLTASVRPKMLHHCSRVAGGCSYSGLRVALARSLTAAAARVAARPASLFTLPFPLG